MRRKRAVSIIAILLAVLMLLGLFISAIPIRAHADELDELKARKEELSAQVAEIKKKLEGLEDEKSTVLERKAALEEQNDLANAQLEIISSEIEKYDTLIENKAQEVATAKNRENRQLEKYRTRIRSMEENGGYNILALILQAESFSDLLSAFDDMGEIMQSDKRLQRQYEAEKAVYEANQAELRQEQAEILKQVEDATSELERLEEEIEQAIRAYEAAEQEEANAAAAVANMIAANNAKRAQERAAAEAAAAAAAAEAQRRVQEMTDANAAAAAAGEEAPYSQEEIQAVAEDANIGYVSGSSEGFIWPLPCSTRVTSRFGNRTDPFTGETRYHSGIDIDGFGNDGAPVVAAASGTVITASYDSSYGHYIIIDHGGTSTVYAHMSGLAVSYGATVSQGQTIGYVGSTGRATGTHLHFEVYVGDGRVDPAQYFSGISYYQC